MVNELKNSNDKLRELPNKNMLSVRTSFNRVSQFSANFLDN